MDRDKCKTCLNWTKFFLSFLMIVDMITDILTIKRWKLACEEGRLGCHWWAIGVIFFVLPTIAATAFLVWKGGTTYWGRLWVYLAGPLYIFWSPMVNVIYRLLVCLIGKDQINNKDISPSIYVILPFVNLFEVIFESFPQMIIQWYWIVNESKMFDKGLESWHFALFSAMVSTLSVVYGAYVGIRGAVFTKCLTIPGIV